MNSNHTNDLLGVIELLGNMTEKMVRLRDNLRRMKGLTRQQEIVCQLSIIEIELGFVSRALQELLETTKIEHEQQKGRFPMQREAAIKGNN